MKRHTQLTGIRNWYGGDLIDLQAESLKVLDGFFTQYGNFIVSGCQAVRNGATYDVSPGIVALQGKGPQGEDVRVIAPFEGAQGVALPFYLTLRCETLNDTYVDGNVQPIAHAYKAVGTGVKPGVVHLEISAATGGARLTDVMQDTLHRFITDAERTLWNGKESPSGAQSKADAALATAKAYADTKDAATLASAKTYADGKAATALADAKTYADGKAATALADAKTYADTKETTAGAQTKANKALADAKTYADGKAATALADAKTYADGKDTTTLASAKTYADTKASTAVATQSANGLMAAADKAKLDGVAASANNYTHPNDANTRHVTDAEKTAWNAKVDKITGKGLSTNDYTTAEKAKLASTMAYDYVVDSNAKLAGLNSTTGVSSVLIRKGKWVYNSSNGKGISLSSSITTIVGEAGSELVFRGVTEGACLGYPNPIIQPPLLGCTYSVRGVTIRNESAAGTMCFEWMDNLYNCFACFNTQCDTIGFISCENLYSCGVENWGEGTYGTGFSSCSSLYSCYAKISNVFGGQVGVKIGFSYCSGLYDCSSNTMKSTMSFLNCRNMTNCSAAGTIEACNGVHRCSAGKYTLSYASSYNDSSAYLCADTPAGGWNR